MQLILKNYSHLAGKSLVFVAILKMLSLSSCVNSPNYDIVPQIDFIAFSKNTINQGSVNNDSTTLIISFVDGDGDIGYSQQNPTESNLFIIDNRTQEIYGNYRVPAIPEQGANNGITGEMKILLLNTCCIFPMSSNIPPCEKPSNFPTNNLSFTVYLVDRAGNKSNELITPSLQLLCN